MKKIALLILAAVPCFAQGESDPRDVLRFFEVKWADFFSAYPNQEVDELKRRQQQAQEAVESMPDGPLKDAILVALKDHGAVLGRFSEMKGMRSAASPFAVIGEKCELKKDQIAAILRLNPRLPQDLFELKNGQQVKLESVTVLNPTGLRWIAQGIEEAPWSELNPQVVELFGWTPDVKTRYEAWKEAAVARSAAMVAAEKRSASANEKNQPQVMQAPASLRGDLAAAIEARVKKEWPADFSMQDYERKKQRAAIDKIRGYIATGALGVPSDVMTGIIQRAANKWGTDFSMIVYDIENEVKAYRR